MRSLPLLASLTTFMLVYETRPECGLKYQPLIIRTQIICMLLGMVLVHGQQYLGMVQWHVPGTAPHRQSLPRVRRKLRWAIQAVSYLSASGAGRYPQVV